MGRFGFYMLDRHGSTLASIIVRLKALPKFSHSIGMSWHGKEKSLITIDVVVSCDALRIPLFTNPMRVYV